MTKTHKYLIISAWLLCCAFNVWYPHIQYDRFKDAGLRTRMYITAPFGPFATAASLIEELVWRLEP